MDRASTSVDINVLKIESSRLKEMDLEHYYKLRRSLQDFGQLRNILVDAEYNVVEGRKIASIMRELGLKQIEVKVVTGDALIACLNLNSEYSTFDFVKVSVQLSKSFDLSKKEQLYDRLPFKNSDINDYIEAVDFSFGKMNAHRSQNQGSLFGDL